MKKIKILILASIMTLSICATALAAEVNTVPTNGTITTQSSTDPHPW